MKLFRINHQIVIDQDRPKIVLEFIGTDGTCEKVKFTYAQFVHFINQLEM